jgi:hypothetical protein
VLGLLPKERAIHLGKKSEGTDKKKRHTRNRIGAFSIQAAGGLFVKTKKLLKRRKKKIASSSENEHKLILVLPI